jgi:pimeloyl-ACP methyl ester carboxylesterase
MNVSRKPTLAAILTGTLLLTACLPSMEQVSPDDSTPWPGGGVAPSWSGDPTLLSVYTQVPQWEPCGDVECATIQVPQDWSDPAGPTVGIVINRVAARVPGERLGSLLVNPGGPGGSGLEFVGDLDYGFATFAGDDLLDHYDVIGFDPRGVGQSTPINCGSDEELDAYLLVDDVVQTQAELDAARLTNAEYATRCRELTGPLVENVDTSSAARDMDVIRAIVGDSKLNYLGYSYGSQLGATYITLYPENVGHVVLDGAEDFLLPTDRKSLDQAAGFEQALDAYIADCIGSSSCPLPRDAVLAKRTIQDMLTQARDEGIPTDTEDLNGTLLTYGIVVTLYDEGSWSYLSGAFREVIERGTGRTFLELANWYLDRDEDGHYFTNANEAFGAISCLDIPAEPLMSIADFRDFQRRAEEASPTLGWWFGAGPGCEGWPWTAKEPVIDVSAGAGAAPFLFIGTTGDPATPYEGTVSLAARFPNATLVTYVGEGHTAYGRSNQCIVDAVDSYFVGDVLPATGLTC